MNQPILDKLLFSNITYKARIEFEQSLSFSRSLILELCDYIGIPKLEITIWNGMSSLKMAKAFCQYILRNRNCCHWVGQCEVTPCIIEIVHIITVYIRILRLIGLVCV